MIDQRYFKYIKTIAQYHSFSKAAQVLYISQPALSRFVKKVEEELGASLFDRETIPLGLTQAGERYLHYMEQFQQLEAQMYSEFAAHGAGVQGCFFHYSITSCCRSSIEGYSANFGVKTPASL